MSELSIAKLAIPRKANVDRQTASYVDTETAYTVERVSTSQTTVISDIGGWNATVYTNNSSDTITRVSDISTGTITYSVINVDTIDGYFVRRIECTKPDGTTFMINPGYSLDSGNYVVEIRFDSWWCRPALSASHVQFTGLISYPYSREIRTNDGINFGIALPTDMIGFKVQYLTYYAPTKTLFDWQLSSVLDSNATSQAGTGGLTAYRVRAGAWDTNIIYPKKQDISISWGELL